MPPRRPSPRSPPLAPGGAHRGRRGRSGPATWTADLNSYPPPPQGRNPDGSPTGGTCSARSARSAWELYRASPSTPPSSVALLHFARKVVVQQATASACGLAPARTTPIVGTGVGTISTGTPFADPRLRPRSGTGSQAASCRIRWRPPGSTHLAHSPVRAWSPRVARRRQGLVEAAGTAGLVRQDKVSQAVARWPASDRPR